MPEATTAYERHPFSAAWPDMSPDDFQALRDRISTNGLRDAIVLYDGQILDGWQRYQACLAEDIEPRFEVFHGSDDEAVDFVNDKHTRRPLTLTQRLACIATMMHFRGRGRPNKSATIADFSEGLEVDALKGGTVAELAQKGGASVRTAASVKAAIERGTPQLAESMRNGSVSANVAEQIARLPAEEQPKALEEAMAPKPKKVAATKLVDAEVRATHANKDADEANAQLAGLQEDLRNARDALAAVQEENDLLKRVVDADEPLTEAVAAAKRALEQARGHYARTQSQAAEIAELKRSVNYWKKRAGQPA